MLYVHAVPGPAMIDLPQRLNRSASRCSDVLVEGTIIYLIVVASRVETSGFEAASVECGIVVRPPEGAWHLPFLHVLYFLADLPLPSRRCFPPFPIFASP